MSGLSISEVNGKTDKEQSTHSPLIELRNGRVIFNQKSISLEKQSETLQEIVKFREMLEQRIANRAPPLTDIPDEHKPLIAKLVHESDKTLSALVKHVHRELHPSQGEDGNLGSSSASPLLPVNVVEVAIKSIVARNNYGLDEIPNGGKPPAALCVWRWEVKEQYRDWLPKNARDKVGIRLAERAQAKKDLRVLIESLSQEEREMLFQPKGAGKLPPKATGKINIADDVPTDSLVDGQKPSQNSKKRKLKDQVNDIQRDNLEESVGQPRKPVDPERAAKEKERQEKKAAKAEKEKKEKDAHNKSRSLMANFFGRAKGGVTHPPYKDADSTVAGPSSCQSEFERTFKPFVLKKDTNLAPVNWFLEARQRGITRGQQICPENDIIVVDSNERVMRGDVGNQNVQGTDIDIGQLSAKDRLRSILSSLPPSVDPPHFRRASCKSPSRLKINSSFTVRDIISQLSEAEIAGDISTVRSLLSKLRDRSLLPAKIVIFAEDARPGYFGTWTHSSRTIGPRTPFARDILVFDYGYDSGEEWEEEPAGEADDVVDDGDDEDVDAEDADSDLDSWLVEDDDVEEPGTPLEKRAASPSFQDFPGPAAAPKRKSEEGEGKLAKKRKVVVPLVPFAKGPCWEPTVGQCEYDVFKPYRIQLFNDTPFPIDPFTFVTNVNEEKRVSTKPFGMSFAVPSLPDRLTCPNQMAKPLGPNGDQLPSAPISTTLNVITQTTSLTKTNFPDDHLPFLLTKISTLQTASMTFLVEAIYQDLRAHKVKKKAIEAKVREVGEKCKEKKVWVIKQDIRVN